MTEYENVDEDGEYVQNVQSFGRPKSSKYTSQDVSRTGGGYDDLNCGKGHLFGLSDKLPYSIRYAGVRAFKFIDSLIKGTYRFACNFSWFAFSTAIILFAPLIIEYERKNDGDTKRPSQILGPGVAVVA